MRKYFLRIENLLLIFPLLSFFFSEGFDDNSTLDIHLHDTYFVITNSLAFVPVFFGMLLLYLFHVILRLANKWGGKFCRFHIYGTMGFYALIFVLSRSMSYYGLAGAPRRYYDVSAWKGFSLFSSTQIAIAISCVLFLVLQLVFFFYFVIRILRKSNSNP